MKVPRVSVRNTPACLMLAMAAFLLAGCPDDSSGKIVPGDDIGLSPLEQLGKHLFFDSQLSTPPGQACSACHSPEVGWTGPAAEINAAGSVYPGAVHVRFGNRKPPASAYAGESPVLYYDEELATWVGGMFWDGRATGLTLGDPLAEQALGPFLNPLEQNMPMARLVIKRIAGSSYASLFEEVWGPGSLDFVKDVAASYERVGRSISAYEHSAEVNPFTSKYDYYLKGEASLTTQEAWGMEVFEGKGNCSACHPNQLREGGLPPLFTDFAYDNLGVPKNPQNPFYQMPRHWNPARAQWVDPGLGGFLKNAGYAPEVYEPEWGKMKVPTLRNADRRPSSTFVKAYGHNGFFKSLKEIVAFYNTRDVASWPEPEVPQNVNEQEVGNLGLSEEEEDAVVAFMQTLSDGWVPAP
ncbi:MAG: cytochrome C [Candidatus Hydrogenedentes bacterium]|nr:cytochrome C [Candidatus Hydrogenedentota bacterium]